MLHMHSSALLHKMIGIGLLFFVLRLPTVLAVDSILISSVNGDTIPTITTAGTPVTAQHSSNSDTENTTPETAETAKAIKQFMDDLAQQPQTFRHRFSIGAAYVYNARLLNSKLKKGIPDPFFSNSNQNFPHHNSSFSDHTEDFSSTNFFYDTDFRIFVRSPEISFKEIKGKETFYRFEVFYEKGDFKIDGNPLEDGSFDYDDSSHKLRLFDNIGFIFQGGYYIIPSKVTFYGGLGVQSFKYELQENLVYSSIFSPTKSSSGSKTDRGWGAIISLGMDYYFSSRISANFFINGSLNFIDGTSAKIPQVDDVFGEAYIPDNSPGVKYKLFSYTSGVGLSFHF